MWAPNGGTTGAAVWDASLFSEDPGRLRALVALLNRPRFLAVAPADRLPALLAPLLRYVCAVYTKRLEQAGVGAPGALAGLRSPWISTDRSVLQ
ncbi:MAG TPA: hypothetical protein VMV92_01845 [Streptosporangiaceae bacterium]|nr:hypothetical protein [Streptosporangiaceae bacterium]